MTEFIHAIDIPRRTTPASASGITGSGSITPSPGPASFNPLTPSSLSASTSNPFDFAVPSLPPRLSRVGRRISEIGMNVLAGSDFDGDTPSQGSSSPYGSVPSSRRESTAVPVGIEEVPGMGDEPIMCPFCNKPLPPAFVITQMAHIHAQASAKERKRSTMERKGSMRRQDSQRGGLGLSKVDEVGASVPMSAVASAPVKALPGPGDKGVAAPVEAKSKSMADITTSSLLASTAIGSNPVSRSGSGTTTPKPVEDVPKATAESLLPRVKEAEMADIAGAASIISPEEVKRWSTLAGISLPSTSTSISGPKVEKPEEKIEKVIPAIPPPPPPSSTAADRMKQHDRSASTSKLGGIFRRGSAKPAEAEEDTDEEDGYMGGGGYAKLNGPASPDREEMPISKVEKKEEAVEDKLEDKGKKEVVEVADKSTNEGKQDEELRKLLMEVLGKVNSMSKSHEDLLHSHTTLLTSLKIARSNLAMAEANSEMLEEQLKRVPVISAAQPRVVSAQTAAPSRSQTPVPSINAPARKSLDESRPMPPPSSIPRRSEETRRPASLIMPPTNLYNNGPQTGPATTRPSTESKGMFGFLGGKTKLPGGLGTISIPSAKDIQATASRFGDTLAGPPTRPGTPSGSREGGQFFDYHPPAQYSPVVNPQRAQSTDSLAVPPPRSASPGPSSPNMSTSPNLQRPIPVPPALTAELTKLRLAYSTSQTRMESMNKELTELKKGKIEMEAELESLSQALFEEANKMVAEERRRRAELEESLKEVKEEREALRETIKVLGGDQMDMESEKQPKQDQVESQEDSEDKDDWRPRDLDKHYEALRKTIHHVADGTAPSTAFTAAVNNNQDTDQGIRGTTGIGQEIFPVVPRVEMSPIMPTIDRGVEKNPWAEPNFGIGVGAIQEEPEVRGGITEEIDPLSEDRAGGEGPKSQGKGTKVDE